MKSAPMVMLLICSGCVSVSWERKLREVPLPAERHAGLQPGTATLNDCLRELGAPLLVWELSQGRFAIAYGWDENREVGLSVSVPLAQRQSANFDYDEINLHTRGVVFFFNAELVLESSQIGRLNAIREQARRRPDLVEP